MSELGYRRPLTLSGLEGRITLSFPVPAPARSGRAVLTLGADAFVTAGFSAVLDLAIDGQAAASRTLGPGPSRQSLTLDVPPELLRSGALRLTLQARAAASSDRCRDARLGGAILTLDPGSALAIALAPDAVKTPGDAFALLPATVKLALPDGTLSTDELQAALRRGAQLLATGHNIAVTPPQEADIVLTRATRDTSSMHPLELALDDTTRPAAAERAKAPPQEIALAALGVATGTQHAAPRADWHFDIALADLPPDRRPRALALAFVTGADLPGLRHILHLFVNGTLAASTELRSTGRAEPVELPIPAGLLSFHNSFDLRFERVSAQGCAEAAATLPVSLDPSARLLLAPAPTRARQFLDIAEHARAGLDLYVPPDALQAPGPVFPGLAALVRDYARDDAPLTLHPLTEDMAAPKRAFVLVSASPPRASRLPLRLENGLVMLAAAQAPLGTLRPAEGGFAALIGWGGAEGIWVAPAAARRDLAAIELARGDLALFNETGVIFWMNSATPRGLSFSAADSMGLSDRLERAWPFGAAALWALLTLFVLIRLARRALRR